MAYSTSVSRFESTWTDFSASLRRAVTADIAARQHKADRLAAPYLLRLSDEELAALGHRREDVTKLLRTGYPRDPGL